MGRFEPNEAFIDELLHGPVGPVYRHVEAYAERVAIKARALAPIDHGREGAGDLVASIHVDPIVRTADGLTTRVIADPVDRRNGFHYGLVAHEGHGVIRPRTKPFLRFYWASRGVFVEDALKVRATSGTPFLTNAMIQVNESTADGFLLEPGDENHRVG